MAPRNGAAKAQTQGMRTLAQLLGQHQLLKAQAANGFTGRVTEHAFGTGIEGADHPFEVGGDDRNLGRGIQHAAQLVVGATQRLFADLQRCGALCNQGQGPLTLAEQVEQQHAQQQAQQTAQCTDCQHRRRTVGLQECQAGADTQQQLAVRQVQHLIADQRQGRHGVVGVVQNFWALPPGRVNQARYQVIVRRHWPAIADQLRHAQQGQHITRCHAVGRGNGEYRGHHHQAAHARFAGIQLQRLRHRHAPRHQRPRKHCPGRILRSQVETRWQPRQGA